MRPSVHAVIAVKTLGQAKSRLADRLPPPDRTRLVLAMLADTVTAALTTPGVASVTVVTPDPAVTSLVHELGALALPEPVVLATDPAASARNLYSPSESMPATAPRSAGARATAALGGLKAATSGPPPTSGLNAALSAGAAAIRQLHGPVDLLALQADLPALRSPELADVLSAAGPGRSVVADHAGSGTVALLVRGGAGLEPLFGPDSARRHIAAGAVELLGDWPGLRQDVDTAADLECAAALGVGAATGTLLGEIGVSRACRPVKQVRRTDSSRC
ncbi:2-phospho-L-lactate guanylyltransferase [Nocardia inohanensis]|uniref:2-phospho-L-lactate guanylyltransferase n=1 Tax=Nocardia inohanensis TaxID=209246 RepID=UPI00082DE0FE|nr:2-phospho-L-lactate guanylyltransferase [Nocardia inohanensis]